MFNTTTIPTPDEVHYFTRIFSILSMGMLIGGSMIELFLLRLREKERSYLDYESSDEEEEEEEDYCAKYQDEFAALPLHKLSDDELSQLNKKIVREQIAEKVEVIMTFDKATETFWYYTDQLKEVSYPILETVARKFAIENNCKSICLQVQAEAQHVEAQHVEAQHVEAQHVEAQHVEAEHAEAEQAEAEQAEAEAEHVEKQVPIPSVFAKFKNYNAGKGSAPNFTSVVKVIEQMNHFRYRGKIVDYEEREKTKEKVIEPTIDYASYKKLLMEKKEN
jgi:hypothetical protein